MQSLPKEYQWEPQIALRSGTDGLQLTHYILANAAKYLSASGVLLVEVGNSWQELERQYPKVTFNWLTPEVGGFGIFWFKREQLIEYKQYFNK
jgi:ribosomal protein L3 glutamine methyltransferase